MSNDLISFVSHYLMNINARKVRLLKSQSICKSIFLTNYFLNSKEVLEKKRKMQKSIIYEIL